MLKSLQRLLSGYQGKLSTLTWPAGPGRIQTSVHLSSLLACLALALLPQTQIAAVHHFIQSFEGTTFTAFSCVFTSASSGCSTFVPVLPENPPDLQLSGELLRPPMSLQDRSRGGSPPAASAQLCAYPLHALSVAVGTMCLIGTRLSPVGGHVAVSVLFHFVTPGSTMVFS